VNTLAFAVDAFTMVVAIFFALLYVAFFAHPSWVTDAFAVDAFSVVVTTVWTFF
jgi:hypothetical protein